MKSLGLLLATYGVLLAVGAASGGIDPLRPLAAFTVKPSGQAAGRPPLGKEAFRLVASGEALAERLAFAPGRPPRPTLLYVTAEWCITCRAMERSVLPAPDVTEALADFRLLAIDLTDLSAAKRALLHDLQIVAPQTCCFSMRMAGSPPPPASSEPSTKTL
jgi:thiol:disulfide interchange protein DsbD